MNIAKLIGGIVLLIAGLAYFNQQNMFTILLFAIAGLILLLAPSAKKHFDIFVATFDKKLLFTALYDFLYLAFMMLTAYTSFHFLQNKLTSINPDNLNKLNLITPEQTSVMASTVQTILFSLLGTLLALILVNLIAYSIFKWLAWTTLTEQKFNKKTLLSFLGLNAAWWALWSIPYLALLLSLRQAALLAWALQPLTALYAYFTIVVHTLFTKQHKIGNSLTMGIALSLSKIHKLIVPYTYIFLVFAMIGWLIRIIPSAYTMPALALYLIFIVTFTRAYIYKSVKDFKA